MLTIAAIASLLCLALPVAITAQMMRNAPHNRAEISAAFAEHRTCRTPPSHPSNAQGAAPTPPRTVAAPCHPARCNGHEVSPS